MKRIAIISLLAVFLTTNYAYATITTEELSQAMERAQRGELTQGEAEELFLKGINSLGWENLAHIKPNASPCQRLTAFIFLNLIAYPSSPTLALWNIVANTRLYLLLCRPRFGPQFGAINPNQGEQESTLVDVEIACVNTRFRDDPPVFIQFSPPEGLTVLNVTVISNTELEFDLEIAADAPLGIKSVIVTYGFPATSIAGSNVFAVVESTF